MNKRTKTGKTTIEENAKCHQFYHQKLLALDDPTDADIKAFMYGDTLRNYLGLIDINNHLREDNMKSIKFRERKHVKDARNIDNEEFMMLSQRWNIHDTDNALIVWYDEKTDA